MTTLPQIYNEGGDLSPFEKTRFNELETVIKENFTGFVAVGNALAEIRDSKLYRQEYKSFEDYCQNIWDVHSQFYELSAVVYG